MKDQNNQNPEELISKKEEKPSTRSKKTNTKKTSVKSVKPVDKDLPETIVEEQESEMPATVAEPEQKVKPAPKAKKKQAKKSKEPEIKEKSGKLEEEEKTEILSLDKEPVEEEGEKKDIENFNEYSKEQLVATIETLIKEDKIDDIKTKVALLKLAFQKITKEEQKKQLEQFLAQEGNKEKFVYTPDSLEERFYAAFEVYRAKRAEYLAEQERIKQENLEAKNQIIEELKELISSEETLKKTYDDFRALQEKWRNIGIVPRSEINNLWQNYHFLVEKFFDKVKINKELRDLDLRKNLERKIDLCGKAEELLLEPSLSKSFKELQKLHEKWKEAGPVPEDKKDEIWERFKDATDKINQERRNYHEKRHMELQSNLEAKTAICKKVEQIINSEIITIKQWNAKTDEITELSKIWKSIGPTPKKDNDAIWEQFKTYLNTFFSIKRDYFAQLKEEQINNYNLKLDLCAQAEAFMTNTNWRITTQDFLKLQEEWKKIGAVPRKNSDKIWKRFRTACDTFFNNKSNYFSNIQENEGQNLKLKKELIQKVKDYKFGSEKTENLETLKEFQREWTEIGHVPIKEKDKIHQEFRSAINGQLDKLKISQFEMNTMNYKSKMDSIKESPNAGHIISKEKNHIANKISQLKSEVILLENNMGFLANSKKADVIREEFDKKLQNTKDEIALLEAKLKYINKMDKES